LATDQLHVWVVALDVGMIGDNQSAGITVAVYLRSTLANLRNAD